MRVKMSKPYFFIRSHLLADVDPFKSHAATNGGSGWLKIIDSTGKTVFLSKTMQRKYFDVTEEA